MVPFTGKFPNLPVRTRRRTPTRSGLTPDPKRHLTTYGRKLGQLRDLGFKTAYRTPPKLGEERAKMDVDLGSGPRMSGPRARFTPGVGQGKFGLGKARDSPREKRVKTKLAFEDDPTAPPGATTDITARGLPSKLKRKAYKKRKPKKKKVTIKEPPKTPQKPKKPKKQVNRRSQEEFII